MDGFKTDCNELEKKILEQKKLIEELIKEAAGRKFAQEAFRESEYQYRATLNSLGDAIHVIDNNLCFVIFNPAFKRWNRELGLETDVIGKYLIDVFPFLDNKVVEEYRYVFKTGKTLVTDENIMIGEKRFFTETRKIPVFDGGDVVRVITVIRDFTDRWAVHEALKSEREQLLSIFESIDEFIYVSDPETYELVYANKAIKEVFGYEVVGQNCFRVFHDLNEPCEFCTNDKIFGPNAVPVYIWEHNNKKLNIWLKCMDRPIKWPDGRTLRYEMAIDITAMKESHEKLEEQVEERTKVLKETQEKLLASERLALLGKFSGSISHELRNPLGVISTSAYYLKRKAPEDDKKVVEHLDTIRRQVKKCSNIIESILNLTRMNEPEREIHDIHEIVKEVVDLHEPRNNVKIILNSPEEPQIVYADREHLKMVFRNIIENAIQAIDEKGCIRVYFSEEIRGAEKYVNVKISDSGPGIEAAIGKKIFEPLFTTKARGIGFGLSIAKAAVEKNAGTIEIESASGSGASFIVSFPIKIGNEDQL